MVFTQSFGSLAIATLLCLSPSPVVAQNDTKASQLHSCLSAAGVKSSTSQDATWANDTTAFQKRIEIAPSAVAHPLNKDQVALSLDCARKSNTTVSALGAGHSFQTFGFGNPGNLIVNMEAFQDVSYDKKSKRLTFGGGSHVGPTLKWLWDNEGRHFPHVRGAHVGLAGSSMGGGFGSTSRHLGAAVDNLHSVEFMLYNGTIVNATKGSDLFWAAQGAGSSFGIALSMTTDTHKPLFPTAVNFTLNAPAFKTEDAAKAIVAVQDFSLTKQCPDELAIRMSLTANASAIGYFYGDPTKFDGVIAPLLAKLQTIGNVTLQKNELPFWDMEVSVAGPGMNQPSGGSQGGRSFYLQSLTTTTDRPFTVEQVKVLLDNVNTKFNRTDLRGSGFLDLWGGRPTRNIRDKDSAYAHGKNLWLVRFDGVSVDIKNFPADGLKYLQSIWKPFENALTAAKTPIRGFPNYVDSELSEAEWSSRLYGKANYARLKQLKSVYDPEGVFTNRKQAIAA